MDATKRQEEILEQARRLLRDGGLAGLTMKKIAERVGFTEPALYRHFSSKQELLLALMGCLDRDLVEPARRTARRGDLPPEQRLRRILDDHFRLIREHDSLPFLLLSEASASGEPEFLDKMRNVFTGYLACLTDLVVEARPASGAGEEDDADVRAMVLLGAAAGAAIRHRLVADAAEAERIERRLIPLVIESVARSAEQQPGTRRTEDRETRR